jgi:hypothetical protein
MSFDTDAVNAAKALNEQLTQIITALSDVGDITAPIADFNASAKACIANCTASVPDEAEKVTDADALQAIQGVACMALTLQARLGELGELASHAAKVYALCAKSVVKEAAAEPAADEEAEAEPEAEPEAEAAAEAAAEVEEVDAEKAAEAAKGGGWWDAGSSSVSRASSDFGDESHQRQDGGGYGATWRPTQRTVRVKDGSTRTLFANPARPGDLRVRKMVQRKSRSGAVRTVATYVSPFHR